MAIEIYTFTLGPLANNTYILVEPASKQAAVVDPTFDSRHLVKSVADAGWDVTQIWLTHAHFDHTAGIPELIAQLNPAVTIGLHPADLPLYHDGGGARQFGIDVTALPEPSVQFEHGQLLKLGTEQIEVRHTPGHSPGHVIFVLAGAEAALVGDLIFKNGVGRTDLPGGSMPKLLRSIYNQVFTLPPQTRLLSGHGPETTVSDEKEFNPYIG